MGSNFDWSSLFSGSFISLEGWKYTQSRPFKTKKDAYTLPKQLPNNFEKVQNTTFLTPKMAKNDPSERPKWANFWPKTLIFEVIYGPLELKIHSKVGLFRPKTMPKHFLNNSKTTLKIAKIRLFWPPKWPKMAKSRMPILQKVPIFGSIFAIRALFMALLCWKKIKFVPPNS